MSVSGLWKLISKSGMMTKNFTKADITKPFNFYECYYYHPVDGEPDDDPYEENEANRREFLGYYLSKEAAEKYGKKTMYRSYDLSDEDYKRGLRCFQHAMCINGNSPYNWITEDGTLN